MFDVEILYFLTILLMMAQELLSNFLKSHKNGIFCCCFLVKRAPVVNFTVGQGKGEREEVLGGPFSEVSNGEFASGGPNEVCCQSSVGGFAGSPLGL